MVATHGAIVHGMCQIAGRVIHPSHKLRVFKGIFVCVRCGYLAAGDVRKLQDPCLGIVSNNRERFVLKRLRQGMLPYSRTEWPVARPPAVPHMFNI